MLYSIAKPITLILFLNILENYLTLCYCLLANVQLKKITHVTFLLYFKIITIKYKTKYNQFIYNDIQLFT